MLVFNKTYMADKMDFETHDEGTNFSPLVGRVTAKKFARKHVFRAGAVVWAKSKGRDYYVVFRSLSRPYRGIQIPGGRVERVENVAQTILREIREETGLDTRIVCPLGYMFFENTEDDYSSLQVFYIVRPIKPIDVTKKWQFIDRDESQQIVECWCVPVETEHSFLSHNQGQIVDMFRQWLEEHKKVADQSSPVAPLFEAVDKTGIEQNASRKFTGKLAN